MLLELGLERPDRLAVFQSSALDGLELSILCGELLVCQAQRLSERLDLLLDRPQLC